MKAEQKSPAQQVPIKRIYVDEKVAAEILSLSVANVQRLERDPESGFPKRRLLSPRRTGFLLREIEEWSENRPLSDLPPPPNTGAKKPRASSC